MDDMFLKRYDKQTYNCAHWAAEVFKRLTGYDVLAALTSYAEPTPATEGGHVLRRDFRRLEGPSSPCLVLMRSRGMVPHVGVYFQGKVLHFQETGAQYAALHLVSFNFKHVQFYTCREFS